MLPRRTISRSKPHTSDVFPGFTFGGPIWKDKIFGFVGIQSGVE